jgi:hypothetical protein
MNITLLLLFFFTLSAQPAHAYLDPGTGSYLLQLIIGGALGGIFILKNYWHKLTSLFIKKSPKTQTSDTDTSRDETK